MKVIVLGSGIIGTTTAYYLAKNGHDVDVVERQPDVAMETSFANGGVLHTSEAEPWSQPGMPRRVLSWIGKEDAPMLLRV
ncbi:MAG: FAD-dependent oxidoreductase, partial [bacterium]|nr:FAD-dependent oxidoreductase [bacterium]